jgi:hypothetical protein
MSTAETRLRDVLFTFHGASIILETFNIRSEVLALFCITGTIPSLVA